MKNVKAIIFDAYGTLFDVNSAAEKCKDQIGDKWEGFANFWRTTQLEYTWLRSLMKRHEDFWKITEDSLDKSMKAFNIDPSMKDELLNLYKVLSPFKEVPEVLKVLKEKKTHTDFFSIFAAKNFFKPKNKENLIVSFVMKKKIGNAVKRNKIKRRLKNIMNDAVKRISINCNFSFLVIAKSTMLNNEFKIIKDTIFQDFKKIK